MEDTPHLESLPSGLSWLGVLSYIGECILLNAGWLIYVGAGLCLIGVFLSVIGSFLLVVGGEQPLILRGVE